MMVADERAAEDARQNLTRITEKLRTGATSEVIVSNGRSFNDVLHESSKDADLIFMGMATPDENFAEYYKKVQTRLSGLPTTVMVLAGEDISYGDVLLQQDAFDED
jgi:DNA-binding LytR/AlgR family response regulator